MADAGTRERPAAPTTEGELERSIRVLQLAVLGAIGVIVVLTVAFIAIFDAPLVPLLPIAGFVVIVDIFMLNTFVRQRRRALEDLRRREAGAA
ncbi:MAG TPA: hypothetical protein VKA36_00485 [Solirubrobacterales bacterium]|nr:hypothetical protein [Solirubrobacterales bacterium]